MRAWVAAGVALVAAMGLPARAEPSGDEEPRDGRELLVSNRLAFRGGLLATTLVTPSWDTGPETGVVFGVAWSHFGDHLFAGLDASAAGVPFRGGGPMFGAHLGAHAVRQKWFRALVSGEAGYHAITAACYECDETFTFPFIGVRGEFMFEGSNLALGLFLAVAEDLGRDGFDFRDSHYEMGGTTLGAGVTLSLLWRRDEPDPAAAAEAPAVAPRAPTPRPRRPDAAFSPQCKALRARARAVRDPARRFEAFRALPTDCR